jgi:hypothetical protein
MQDGVVFLPTLIRMDFRRSKGALAPTGGLLGRSVRGEKNR